MKKLVFALCCFCFLIAFGQKEKIVDPDFFTLNNKIRTNFISVPVNDAGWDSNMGLAGLHYLVPISSQFYGGINMHAAVTGDQGGLFGLGVAIGYQQKLIKQLYLDTNLNFGGGGGYRNQINKGAYLNPNIGLAYHFPKFNIGLQYSYFNFYTDNNIVGNSASVFIEVPITINVTQYQYVNKKVEINKNKQAHKNSFVLRSDQFFTIGNSRKDAVNNFELIDETLHLLGFEYQRYINQKTFAFVHTDAIYKGLTAGFMDLFGGLGYEPVQNKYFNIYTKLAFGAAGGRIKEEGGATLYPSAGIEFKLSKHWSIQTHAGYFRAIDGDFEAYTIGGGIKLNTFTGGTIHPNTQQKATKSKTTGIRISLQNQTYFDVNRHDRNPIDLHLIALQANYHLNSYLYLIGQASFAYESNYKEDDIKGQLGAGGYADGMGGLGLNSPIFAHKKLQVFTEALIGAGGGAGIDTGEGLIAKGKIGLYYNLNTTFSLLGSVGKIVSPTTNFNSNNINLGLSVNFASLKSTF